MNATSDIEEMSASELKNMLADSQNGFREMSRSYQKLQQEHTEVLQRRQVLIRDHKQIRQEHRKLRHEHQQILQEQRKNQEALSSHRELHRECQTLRQEHQELVCVHDEVLQLLAIAETTIEELRDHLERERLRFKEQKEVLEDDANHWEKRYDHVVRSTIVPYANNCRLNFNDIDQHHLDIVLKPLREDALRANFVQRQVKELSAQLQGSQAKVNELQGQVRELQNEMLARIEKVQAVPDEQFALSFRSIVAHVKSLSRSVRPDLGIDISQVLEPGVLLLDTDGRHWKIRQHQKYYIESWVWSVLLEHVFATPFSMFGNAANMWEEPWGFLYGDGHRGEQPPPSTSSELYRCTVASELVRLTGRETILTGQINTEVRKKGIAGYLIEGTLTCRDAVASTIGKKLASISSAVDFAEIPFIVDCAFALALEMSLQKCRLQVTYPAIGDAFSNSNMSSIPDLDGDDIDEGNVAFIVHPGLTKWGDAHGRKLDQQYDIVPSLVQLEPVMMKRESV